MNSVSISASFKRLWPSGGSYLPEPRVLEGPRSRAPAAAFALGKWRKGEEGFAALDLRPRGRLVASGQNYSNSLPQKGAKAEFGDMETQRCPASGETPERKNPRRGKGGTLVFIVERKRVKERKIAWSFFVVVGFVCLGFLPP